MAMNPVVESVKKLPEKQIQVQGIFLKFTIHLHCLIPAKSVPFIEITGGNPTWELE